MKLGNLDQIASKVEMIVRLRGLPPVFWLRRKHGRQFILVAMSVHIRLRENRERMSRSS